MKHSIRRRVTALALAALLGMTAFAATAKAELTAPVTLRMASTASGGDYTEVGIITNFLSQKGILPEGSHVTQETISQGATSVGYLIEAGMADIARGTNPVPALYGINGRPPYSNISALFAIGSNQISAQVVTNSFAKKTGYTHIEDCLANKVPCTICTEDIGSSDYVLFQYVFEIMGVTQEEFESWGGKVIHTDNSTASELLQDKQADFMMTITGLTSSTLTELSLTSDVTISSFNDTVINGLFEKGFAPRTIPAGTFDQFPEDAQSAYMGAGLIVSTDMDEELAYTLTKVLFEAREDLAETSSSMRGITPESAVDTTITVVPLHPGAIRYFTEIGVLPAE